MKSTPTHPDPLHWARKLHEAAAELRTTAAPVANGLQLASRLERYAEAILFPQYARDRRHAVGGDD